MAKADFWSDLAAAEDEVADLGAWLSEIRAEHYGEVDRFGDSWPSACVAIENVAASLSAAQERLDRMRRLAFV